MSSTPPPRASVLSLSNLHKGFELGGTRVEVLRGISLELAAGESLAVTGPSGSGKSTLLHIAAGLEHPDAGRVLLGGQELYALSEEERATARRRRIGLVFQEHHLLPQLTALENVLLPAIAERRRATDNDVARAERLLSTVGLAERAGHRPAQLSGGERQRVAVARALMNQPSLVVADEPTGALDRATAREVAELLARVAREEQTALLVATHDSALAAVLDRRGALRDGTMVAEGG